jgi:hypothetical protein
MVSTVRILTKDLGNYIIYSDGKLWSKKRNKFMNPSLHHSGYLVSKINGKTTNIHLLVALAFLPNPNNLAQCDHINSIKTDNRLENLQWMTPGDNTRKAWADELVRKRRSKKILPN